MRTTILAYVIGIIGFIVLIAAVGGLYLLLTADMPRVPFRYFATIIGVAAGGVGLIGLAQALRLLTEILRRTPWPL